MNTDFPRDPMSSYNLIRADAIREAIMTLVKPDHPLAQGRDFLAMSKDMGGWRRTEVLKVAATVIAIENMKDDVYEVRLVLQALREQIALNQW